VKIVNLSVLPEYKSLHFRDLIPKILSNDHTLSHTLIYSPPGFIRFSEERDVFEDEDENEGKDYYLM